jgi:hypothetical protein
MRYRWVMRRGRSRLPGRSPLLVVSAVAFSLAGLACSKPFVRFDLEPLPRARTPPAAPAPRIYAQVRQAAVSLTGGLVHERDTAYAIDVLNEGGVPVTVHAGQATLRAEPVGGGAERSVRVLAAGEGNVPPEIHLREGATFDLVLQAGGSRTFWLAFAPLGDDPPGRQVLVLPVSAGTPLFLELLDPRHAPRWTPARQSRLGWAFLAQTRMFNDGPGDRIFYSAPFPMHISYNRDRFRYALSLELTRLHETGTDEAGQPLWLSTEVAFKQPGWSGALFTEANLLLRAPGESSYGSQARFGFTMGAMLRPPGTWPWSRGGLRMGYSRLFGSFPGKSGLTVGLEFGIW